MAKDLEELDSLSHHRLESIKEHNRITQLKEDKQEEEEELGNQFRNKQELIKQAIIFSH